MLVLVAPDDDGGERRLLLPRAGHRHLEHGPGDPGFAGADLGLVGEVVGEAHGGSVMTLPSLIAWPGGLPGWWAGVVVGGRASQEPSGQTPAPWAGWSTRLPPRGRLAGPFQ